MIDWDALPSVDEDWDTGDIDWDPSQKPAATAALKEKAERAVKRKAIAATAKSRLPRTPKAPPRVRPSAASVQRMTCDACGSIKLKCVDSRPEPEGRYRRYKCLACDESVFTQERKIGG